MAAELFINETGFIATVLTSLTNNITGSLFLSLLMITILLLLICLLFRLPIEFSAVLLVPFFIVCMAATSDYLALGGTILIYLGIIMAKNFFLK